MQFLWPSWLSLLLLVPVLAVIYLRAQRRRQQQAQRYAHLSLFQDLRRKDPGARRHIPALLFLLGVVIMIIAVARPFTVVTIPSLDRTVILAIDVSGSMRAEDMKPNRIEAAKSAARAFVERQEPSTRVGVVSFSGGAFMVQAPTSDHIALLDAINRLNTQRATAIGSGLLTSLDAIAEATGADLPPAQLAIVTRPSSAPAQPTPTSVPQGTYSPAIIILLTDGQNTTGPLPLDAAKVAAGRGVRVFTIGIGTLQGATLSPPGGGDGGFGGAPGGGFGGGGGGFGGGGFRTQLDEATLKQVAKLTDAKYYHASTTEDLHEIYEALDTQLVFKPQNIEVTAFFTAAAAAFLLVGGALSLLWFRHLP